MNETRILVIDDDRDLLTTIESIFKIYEPDYHLILLDKPQHAIEVINRENPTAILTDWEMPDMSGIQVIQQIRKQKQFDSIPIIMSTGVMNDSESLMTALASGANDFILKPFDRIILVARTRSMVSLAQTLKNLQAQNAVISENNNFIRSLIQSIPNPLVYYTTEGIIMGFNESFENFVCVKDNHLHGALIYRRCDEKQADLHLKMDNELMAKGSVKNYETFLECGGKHILHSKTLYRDARGNPEGIMYILTDVTDIRNAQSEIIDSKKRELVSSGLRLIQISEMNSKLIDDLKAIKQHTDKQGTELINGVIADHNSQQNSMSWKEFETRFENVYEDFYKRLKERFPDLTAAEKKLCALLRLNLTSKEIAALTFQASQSVDMARYRLRKKLGLPQEGNLASFLEQI